MAPVEFSDAKQRVKEATDIVDLVREYRGELRREGRNFKALCPWHDDHAPSLHVNPERQTFRCFVCNIGGDVFSFVERMENVAFPEALQILAERAGIPIHSGRGDGGRRRADEKSALLRVMKWAADAYQEYLLNDPGAEVARQYVVGRGISPDAVRDFSLGFAPPQWDWLLARARDESFTAAELEVAGLVSPRQSGSGHYDCFRGRLIFPIRDTRRRPIALGGRILPEFEDEKSPKYVNSTETPLFVKRNTLYGLDRARDAIARSRAALIVEGYTDCMAAHQFGFENTVAVLGTAFGRGHLPQLRGLADRIVLLLDGDEAGKRRANEILEVFVSEPLDLRILTLPEAADPCEFLASHGRAALAELIESSVDALEHKVQIVHGRLSGEPGPHELNRAAEDVLGTMAKVSREATVTNSAARLREEQVLHRLTMLCGVPEDALRARLADLRRSGRRRKMGTDEPTGNTEQPRREDPWQRELVEILVRRPDLLAATRQRIDAGHFTADRAQDVYATCCRLQDAGVEPTFDRLMLEYEDPELKSFLVDLDESAQQKEHGGDAVERTWEALVERYEQRQLDRWNEDHRRRLDGGDVDPEEEKEILRQMIEQQRARRRIN